MTEHYRRVSIIRAVAAALVGVLIFPLGVPLAVYADTVIFTETCASNAQQELNNSTTVTVGTGWSTRITLSGTPTVLLYSGTANCHTVNSSTGGIGYTISPAPTTNEYYIDYIWIDGGAFGTVVNEGVLLNYIDANNYYACLTEDDATPDALIFKVSGGVGTQLVQNVNQTINNNDQLECRIDYNGASPVITYTDVTLGTTIASATDSSSPLTKTPKAGVMCGELPSLVDTCNQNLWFDTVRVSTVPDPVEAGPPSRNMRLFEGYTIRFFSGKIIVRQMQ